MIESVRISGRSSAKIALARLWVACIAVLFFFNAIAAEKDSATSQFKIAPEPAWIVPTPADPNGKPATLKVQQGEYYLLIDQQKNTVTHETYEHFAKAILNESGVQNGSQISFPFDPSYQELTIHSIKVHRGAQTFDKLDADKIKVIQEERNLERHVYDGGLSAVIFLEDVRAGDWIEFAYTIRGSNPVMDGHFSDSFITQWQVPVHLQRFRLLWKGDRELRIKNHGAQGEPATNSVGDLKEYLWEFKDTAPLAAEDSLPLGYSIYPWVQLTDFRSWHDVSAWAEPMYRTDGALPAELKSSMAHWQAVSPRLEDRVLAALHFVQDDVRYLGIEFGPHSHQPNPPTTVFARRFGDCKDKVVLFCTILQAMGVEAYPTLVSTMHGQNLQDWLPSPYAFNHIIAEVKLNGQIYWLDPTRSFQRGSLDETFVSNFERGLVVGKNTVRLAIIPPAPSSANRTKVVKTYRIETYTKPMDLTVETIHYGMAAEAMRAALKTDGTEPFEKSLLNYYAKFYPKIEIATPIRVSDVPGKNMLVLTRHYRVPDFWQMSAGKDRYTCEFYPSTIHETLTKPATVIRSLPLGINYPRQVEEVLQVFLPETYPVTNRTDAVSDAAMTFSSKIENFGTKLVFTYDYETLTNSLPASEVPAHLNKIDQIQGRLGYTLYRSAYGVLGQKQSFEFNWALLFIAFFYSCLLLIGAALLYRVGRKAAADAPPVFPGPLTGIGGWLIAVAITLFIRLISFVWVAIKTYPIFSLRVWEALTVPGHANYHPRWGLVLIFELVANLTMCAGAILNLILFFQKRRTFPRFYLAYLVIIPTIAFADYMLSHGLPGIKAVSENAGIMMFVWTTFFSLMFAIYILKSERVKQTFVK